MEFKTTRKVTVLGMVVAETEIKKEFFEGHATTERRVAGSGSVLELDPNYLTPIVAEAVKRASGLSQSSYGYETGQQMAVDGNVGEYTATQELKKRFGMAGALKVLFGFAAQTGAYESQNTGVSGVFKNHLAAVLTENWEEQLVPVK